MKKSILILSILFSLFISFKSYATTIDWYDRDIAVINTFLDANPDLFYVVFTETTGLRGVNLFATTCDNIIWYNNIPYFIQDGCPSDTISYKYNYDIRQNGFTTPQITSGNFAIATGGSNQDQAYSIIAENVTGINQAKLNVANDCPACETCQTCPPVEPPTDLDKINTSLLFISASLFTLAFFKLILNMYMGLRR